MRDKGGSVKSGTESLQELTARAEKLIIKKNQILILSRLPSLVHICVSPCRMEWHWVQLCGGWGRACVWGSWLAHPGGPRPRLEHQLHRHLCAGQLWQDPAQHSSPGCPQATCGLRGDKGRASPLTTQGCHWKPSLCNFAGSLSLTHSHCEALDSCVTATTE